MQKKEFAKPELEVIRFSSEEILAQTSAGGGSIPIGPPLVGCTNLPGEGMMA